MSYSETWVFNIPNLLNIGYEESIHVLFVCNGVMYEKMAYGSEYYDKYDGDVLLYDDTVVARAMSDGGLVFLDDKYRTITFYEPIFEDSDNIEIHRMYQFLTAVDDYGNVSATKQETPVEPFEETWVINQNLVGEVRFNNTIQFTSNGVSFNSFMVDTTILGRIKYDTVIVYTTETLQWVNEAYRTVTFLEEPTETLLAWLQANAVKQETPPEPEPTPTFEITTAKLTPRSVYTNEPFVISIGFQELVTWLIDRNEIFLIDVDSNYILTGD